MSKKDYVKLAAVFQSTKPNFPRLDNDIYVGHWRTIRNTLCDTLANDNPRFDRERFIAATEK